MLPLGTNKAKLLSIILCTDGLMTDKFNLYNSIVIHDAEQRVWLSFQNPRRLIVAERQEDALAALSEVEWEVKEGGFIAAGFVSYEAAAALDPSLTVKEDDKFPFVWFGIYDRPEMISLPLAAPTATSAQHWIPSVSREIYEDAIRRIKGYIEAGDTYQVNYTLRLRSSFSDDPWAYFVDLTKAQAAAYCAFVNTPSWIICSASPELFFQLDGEQIVSRPMKGTIPRGLTSQADLEQAQRLYNSEKDRAENVMIVDMVRNDLGRIAETGSVEVTSLFDVERYPTLWQMTSTVRARTKAGLAQIMQALFPPASITGAPKRRTMEIIAELEDSPRRIYTGTIGFWMPGRRAQFNVAIRTVLIDKLKGEAEYGVGGGIVWDSADRMEFAECQTKARILTHRQPEFLLLESILWTPEDGYYLLSYHLQRLEGSACYFSFHVDMAAIKERLEIFARSLPHAAQKIRLLVGRTGGITLQASPVDPTPPPNPITIPLSPFPVDSTNPFLYHKTTNRVVYDEALAAAPGYADVILWNEREEVTESTTANLVVEIDGGLYTPPVRCGLLPGTYRAYLLDQGEIKERVITKEDLLQSRRLYLINSVRKKREAVVVPQIPFEHTASKR